MTCGIYLITCMDVKYVGQSMNIEKRIKNHIYLFNRNNHDNPYLQRLWNKYGDEEFSFDILEETLLDEKDLNNKEIYWIEKLNTLSPNGANLMEGGHRNVHTPDVRAKMSEDRRGENNPNWGNHWSEESRKNMSEKMTGKYVGDNSVWFGRHHSEETKNKISNKNKGRTAYNKGLPMSDEQKKKLSESKKGKYKGEESPLWGKSLSEETKNKISDNHADFSGENHPMWGTKRKNASSVYYGVSKQVTRKKYVSWRADISLDGKREYIGIFKTEIEAAKAYNNYVVENHLPNPLNNLDE